MTSEDKLIEVNIPEEYVRALEELVFSYDSEALRYNCIMRIKLREKIKRELYE